MTATASQPTPIRKSRPIWGLARRLGLQAALSVTVMAGLQLASVNGYDIRDLLPVRAPESAREAEPVRVVGVPARFDIPVQAGSALDHIRPLPPAEVASNAAAGPSPMQVAALPGLDRVAVPTPRPRPASARPAAVPPQPRPQQPREVAFDVTPHGVVTPNGVVVYGVAELGGEEIPPMPMQLADAGFRVRDLVPSGKAILTRTAEVTGSAAHVVTGTATRILDLVR